MSLSTIDVVVVLFYAIGIFSLAQYVSREKAGHQKDTSDYFLASKNLPWWAIGASLIAANISAEQIVGMSGSGFAIGLAIASYEWMAALTLLIVGKYLPADLPQEPHLHHAAVPPAALRQRLAGDHGGLLARSLRLREPDIDHLARLDCGQQGGGHRPECRALPPGRASHCSIRSRAASRPSP